MTLSSRHRIRNSGPGGLRPSTLPLGDGGSPQYWLSHVDGEETFFVSFKPPRPGTEPRTLAWNAAVLTTTLGPPPGGDWERSRPQGPKNVHNLLLAVRPLSWACGHGTEMSKTIFDLITPRYFPIWQFKEMSHDFVSGQSVAETCFSHWGYLTVGLYQ